MSTHEEIVNMVAKQMRDRGFQNVEINQDQDIEFVIEKEDKSFQQ